MSQEAWAVVIANIVGFAITIVTNQLSQSRTRGEFRSIMRNFPPHKHVNGKILYPAEFPPPEIEGNGKAYGPSNSH